MTAAGFSPQTGEVCAEDGVMSDTQEILLGLGLIAGMFAAIFICIAAMRIIDRAWIRSHPEAAVVYVDAPSGYHAVISKVNGKMFKAHRFSENGTIGYAIEPGAALLRCVLSEKNTRRPHRIESDAYLEASAQSRHILTFSGHSASVRPVPSSGSGQRKTGAGDTVRKDPVFPGYISKISGDMSDGCRFISAWLGCDVELFKRERDGEKILSRWRELSQAGKQEGFVPLIVVVSDILAERLLSMLEKAGLRDSGQGPATVRSRILEEAKERSAAFLRENGRAAEREKFPAESYGHPDDTFSSHLAGGMTPHSEVLIAKIPAGAPWELAAWMPVTGGGKCPEPADQAAAFRYWCGKYGAVPGLAAAGTWELAVSRPPVTEEDALDLAAEQHVFGAELMFTVGELAGCLKDSGAWVLRWE